MLWSFGSGPAVARTFHRLLAILFAIAWLSLGVQVHRLVGSRGLLPAAPFLAAAQSRDDVGWLDMPTIFWWWSSDLALELGILAGLALSVAALAGWRPRLCAALQTALYLSYVTICRTFLSFQWDNLILECGLLATLLPQDRPAPWIHHLFRFLTFKLYWESGVAKWQSHLGDWQDGSAMTHYFETAPLPAWPAWWAHHLPDLWHYVESWAVLGLELALPLLIFGPRPARLLAALVFTGFQIVNTATANYGFFTHLSVALHVFLLDDQDIERLRGWLGMPRAPAEPRRTGALRRTAAALFATTYLTISAGEALIRFGPGFAWQRHLTPVRRVYHPLRLINTYHLFGHITRERIEPEVQTWDGASWTPHHLRFKPGDPAEPPPFVAPHQPRLDFRLWFYGLGFRRGTPAYVATLLDRLCNDPAAVQGFFPEPLPYSPKAVRLVFRQYHFTIPAERAETGHWWTRQRIASIRAIPCD